MKLFDIIKKSIVTEKTSMWEISWVYVFEVDDSSTKIDIKKAILEIYWVNVTDVRIVNTREKFKQWKKWIVYRKRTAKKAYVTLKDKSSKIDLSITK